MSDSKREQSVNYLTEGEVEEMLTQLRNEHIRGVPKDKMKFYRTRNFLIGLLLSHCGLRRAELAALKWDHVDLENRILNVYEGKGGKDRILGIPLRVSDELSKWKNADYRYESEYIISTRDGSKIMKRDIYKVVQRAAEKANVKPGRSIGPHDLRHSFSDFFQKQYQDIWLTKEALGHSQLKTTQMYVDERKEELIEAMKKFGSSKHKTLKEEVQELKSMVRQLQLLLGNSSSVSSEPEQPLFS